MIKAQRSPALLLPRINTKETIKKCPSKECDTAFSSAFSPSPSSTIGGDYTVHQTLPPSLKRKSMKIFFYKKLLKTCVKVNYSTSGTTK